LKRSATVRLGILAVIGLSAGAQQRPDPCAAANFNEQACQAAIQRSGYCWNGRWVSLKYRNPFPYYYDAYQEFTANGGVVNMAVAGVCGPPARTHAFLGGHGASHGGFGASGSCHGTAAHG
jgi:hypothetical protein